MSDDFQKRGIQWFGRGYFGSPEPRADVTPEAAEEDPWQLWLTTLQAAKKGDFGPTARLLGLYERADTVIFESVCAQLLGDAGTSDAVDEAARMLEATDSFELTLSLSDVLRSRGRLSDVPIILGAYEKIAQFEDAAIVPIYLSSLLEFKPGPLCNPAKFASLAAYREAVMKRHAERADKFGTDRVLLLGGERFGVVRLAERILWEMSEAEYFPVLHRRKLEASTGIDCTGFYRDEIVQPRAAVEIVEGFLQSHASERYEDGVQYFFGHRVPE
ncbi:hypothetical protein WME77_12770 [Sorangium sp. So ce764]|uniref:hypothetical protein n=1 Tax=Sorangium sp. So ce764 TaxID=3133320 RepID=UPI003F5D6629